MTGAPLLDGYTVLDLSRVGPASRCTALLRDLGARVVKVLPPPGREGAEPPFYAYGAGRGVRRLRLDLRAPEGREAFLRLVGRADVVVESYRPGVAAGLGIGYEDCRGANPRIVYCAVTGYGQHGPYARWAGHDLNYLAVGGFLACQGPRADGGPALPGATVADAAAGGWQAAVAILAALLRRAATGEGRYLDVSATEGVVALMSLHLDEHLATGAEPGPGSNVLLGRYACYDVYPARDGRWLAVGAIEPRFFANLCRALGCEQWIPYQLDDDRQADIRAAFRAAFARRDRDEWVAELGPRDTCVAPVLTVAEVARDPHLRARGAFLTVEHPQRGRFEQVGPVVAGSVRPPEPCPVPGEQETHARQLLQEAGYRPEEVEDLRRRGVVG